ncbi:MAG: hypothetical protein D6707_02460, partial [Bacteroidetes bacterium]
MKADKITSYRNPVKLWVTLLSFLFVFSNGWTQQQKGADIDGEAAYDNSGYSVSMPDANTIAIGAPYNDDAGTDAGHVRVYTWNGVSWVQKGSDIDGKTTGDKFGWSVSMPDTNTIAIGAPYYDGGGTAAGYVQVFRWNSSTWEQKGNVINSGSGGGYTGYSISMPDSNTIAVGSRGGGTQASSGHVQIYKLQNFTGTYSVWLSKGNKINGETMGDESGFSVSMPDPNTVAIGAPYNDGSGLNAGHVRVYTWNDSTWVQKGADIDGEAAGDQSGWSVSMPDSNTVAIGAPFNDDAGTDAGHVRIYTWNGTAWIQKGTDIDGEASGDRFGWSISMPDSNTVAIGAPKNDSTGTDAGHVRVYRWNGSNWVKKGVDINGKAADDLFGYSVSMAKSYTLSIGATGNDDTDTDAGQVQVYDFSSLLTSVNTNHDSRYSHRSFVTVYPNPFKTHFQLNFELNETSDVDIT